MLNFSFRADDCPAMAFAPISLSWQFHCDNEIAKATVAKLNEELKEIKRELRKTGNAA
jgi:hypothetical protein